MTLDIEFEFYEATRNFNACCTIMSQHSQDSSLYSRNMSELGIHASLLHSEHTFEPIVKLRKFVKLLRMHDKSTHLYIYIYIYIYIYTYPYGKWLSLDYFTHQLWLLLAVTYLYIRRNLYIVNAVLNQCNMETVMLLCFSCFLLVQGESY